MQQPGKEIKALFMAQYLGQRIVSPSFETSENYMLSGITLDDITTNVKGEIFTIDAYSLILKGDYSEGTAGFGQVGQCDIDEAALILRDISQIKTDELIQIAAMSYRGKENHNVEVGTSIAGSILKDDVRFMNPILWHCVAQYMIAIGILLPFTYLQDGKPITLQTSELIAFNWVKIREDGK